MSPFFFTKSMKMGIVMDANYSLLDRSEVNPIMTECHAQVQRHCVVIGRFVTVSRYNNVGISCLQNKHPKISPLPSLCMEYSIYNVIWPLSESLSHRQSCSPLSTSVSHRLHLAIMLEMLRISCLHSCVESESH